MGLSCMLRRVSPSVSRIVIRRGGAFGSSSANAATICVAINGGEGGQERGFSRQLSYFSKAAPVEDLKNSVQTVDRAIDEALKRAEGGVRHKVIDDFPFQIIDNPGERTVTFEHKYQNEVIKVVVDTPNSSDFEDDGEGSSDDEEIKSIQMAVSIRKEKGSCLEFGVTAYPDEISIDYMSIKNPSISEDEIPYEGPEFTDLDENLQKAFHKYLHVRGVQPKLTNFLIEYMTAKDSKEYRRWLKKLQEFFRQK